MNSIFAAPWAPRRLLTIHQWFVSYWGLPHRWRDWREWSGGRHDHAMEGHVITSTWRFGFIVIGRDWLAAIHAALDSLKCKLEEGKIVSVLWEPGKYKGYWGSEGY